MEKKLIGEWCNPHTYQSTGELKGFNFKKDGVCEAINIPSLDLKTWEIKDGYLIIRGTSIEEDGSKEAYETKEKIEQLTADSLSLVVQEANPRLAFLYLNTKIIKEKSYSSGKYDRRARFYRKYRCSIITFSGDTSKSLF